MVGRPGRSRGARVGVALAAVAGLVVALGGPVAGGPPVDGAAPEATSTLAGANGPIAFERSVPTPLTDDPAADLFADWSPDGTRLVFVSGRDGGLDLYTMDPDGTDVARSTTTDADEHWPRWSPDGARLLATRYTPGEPYAPSDVDLWTTAVDGGDATPLTDSEEESWRGSWSPDGTAVAFDRYPSFPAEGAHEVYLLQLDGSGNRELFAMAPDGTEREQLTDHPATDEDPAWSPDGELVAFVSDRTGAPALHVLDPGSGRPPA